MVTSSQIVLSVLEILEVKPPKQNRQGVYGSYVTLTTKDGQRFQVFAPADIQITPGYDGYMLCSIRVVDHFSDFDGRRSFSPAYIPSEVLRWRQVNKISRTLDAWTELNKK